MNRPKPSLAERGFFIKKEQHDTIISLRWVYIIAWKESFGLRPKFFKTCVRWHHFDVEWTRRPKEIWR